MSFSGDLRAELSGIIPSGRKARETAAAVFLANIGSFSLTEEGKVLLTLSTGNKIALIKCFTLVQKTVNISGGLFARKPRAASGNTGGVKSGPENRDGGQTDAGRGAKMPDISDACFLLSGLRQDGKKDRGAVDGGCFPEQPAELSSGNRIRGSLPEQFTSLVQKMHLVGEDGAPLKRDGVLPEEFLKGAAGRTYLREMFICTGFMSDPGKRYHLEYRCFSEPQSDQLRRVLDEQGIHAGMTRRKKYFVVYVKDSEDISALLQIMGASVSFMATVNARIYKEVRNNVNRRVNCETANIGKTVESAVRQAEDIRILRESGVLDNLPVQIREAAALREAHPGASLSELGELADPPVSRSGMNHRMRKIASLAQKQREILDTTSPDPGAEDRSGGSEE